MAGTITVADLAIADLGPCRFPSPVAGILGERALLYVGEADRILLDDRLSQRLVLLGVAGKGSGGKVPGALANQVMVKLGGAHRAQAHVIQGWSTGHSRRKGR